LRDFFNYPVTAGQAMTCRARFRARDHTAVCTPGLRLRTAEPGLAEPDLAALTRFNLDWKNRTLKLFTQAA